MIHNRFKSLLLTGFAVLSFGCEKEGSETFADLILGKWEWLESVSPWTGLVKNPQTEGCTQTLEFTTEGTMKWYQNDTLSNSTNYHIELYSSESDKYDLIYGKDLRAQISLSNDTLILNSAYVDGPVSSYVRTK